MTSIHQVHSTKFIDRDSGKFINIEFPIDAMGVSVQHEGTGCQCGDFPPIFIEWYDGKPRIIIWADINEEEPTHIIDMSGALETNRKDVASDSQ
jgi:hypothetical protein